MKFTPISPDQLPNKNIRSNTETGTVVNEFLAAGIEVAELDPEGKKVETVRTSIQNAINRNPEAKGTVRVMSRGGRLFLTRVAANGTEAEVEAEANA